MACLVQNTNSVGKLSILFKFDSASLCSKPMVMNFKHNILQVEDLILV
jgi:hypothetical protein